MITFLLSLVYWALTLTAITTVLYFRPQYERAVPGSYTKYKFSTIMCVTAWTPAVFFIGVVIRTLVEIVMNSAVSILDPIVLLLGMICIPLEINNTRKFYKNRDDDWFSGFGTRLKLKIKSMVPHPRAVPVPA